MKNIGKRIERLEEIAGIRAIEEENIQAKSTDFELCMTTFSKFLKDTGQHDRRALKGFFRDDGEWMFAWDSTQKKWLGFSHAWVIQSKRLAA